MKKSILFAILLLVFVSCGGGKQKLPISFEKINLTINDQWEREFALTLDKEGNTYASIKAPKKPTKEYSFLINEQILDSISNVTRRVDVAKIDTAYTDSCKKDECIGYKIELKKGKTTVKTHVKNISKNPKTANLDQLVQLLYNVVRTTDMDPESLVRKD